MPKCTRLSIAIMVVVFASPAAFANGKGQTAKRPRGQSWLSQVEVLKVKKGSYWTRERGWPNRAKGKFAFGLVNTLFGWTELVTEPYEALKKKENVARGMGEGLWNAVGDTAGGALHLVTFPITKLDIPLPEGGIPVEISRPVR